MKTSTLLLALSSLLLFACGAGNDSTSRASDPNRQQRVEDVGGSDPPPRANDMAGKGKGTDGTKNASRPWK